MGDYYTLPPISIPFPRKFVSDQSSPSDASDTGHFYLTSVDTQSTMDHKSGPSSPTPRTVSLRWMDSDPTFHSDTPVRLRAPSLASATTANSTLQSPQDPFFPRRGCATSESEVAPAPNVTPAHKSPHGEKRRSVLQRFSSTLFKINPMQSSLSSPVTPDFPAHISDSKPSIGGFSSGSPSEHGAEDAFGDVDLHPESPRGDIRVDESLATGKKSGEQIPRRLRKPSRSARSEPVPFDKSVDLTPQVLQHAQTLDVYDEDGKRIKFGELWRNQRTCVIFIRHFWCPQCGDYSRSITEHVDPETLEKAGVKLVVISNGSPAMIKSYRRLYKLRFPLYTDPSLLLYHALGMNIRTYNGGPDQERGDYTELGTASGLATVVKNIVTVKMPIHKNGGDTKQLGGEFVLGPGLQCSYVSRMRNTRSHAPIRDVLSAAGVDLGPNWAWAGQPRVSMATNDEDHWMQEREADLRRIRARKGMRRGFTYEHRSSSDSDILRS